jgi:hypothetical protein
MVVNDNAGWQVPRGVLRFIASRLAPTGGHWPTAKTQTWSSTITLVGRCPAVLSGLSRASSLLQKHQSDNRSSVDYAAVRTLDQKFVK